MGKAKLKRHGFAIDMTPLVDVGFLLLTFFMLTAKFKTDSGDTVDVKLPIAQADTTKLPDVNIATLTIGFSQANQGEQPDTLIFYAIANENDRAPIFSSLERVNPKTNAPYTKEELRVTASMLVTKSDLEKIIPATRLQNPSMRFAINADNRLNYGLVDDVMRIMQKYGATRFNLVTKTTG
jgi:biopolymer transport protein ExbD